MTQQRKTHDREPLTWGIKPEWGIPQYLIERMASTRGFSIRYVRQAAKRHVERYQWCLANPGHPAAFSRSDLEELVVQFREQTIPRMIRDFRQSESCSPILPGQIIEYCIVADRLETMLRK